MNIEDKLIAVVEGFGLENLIEWDEPFGTAVEIFYQDEKAADEEEDEAGNEFGDEVRSVLRRHVSLTDILEDFELTIIWFYDQLEAVGKAAQARKK